MCCFDLICLFVFSLFYLLMLMCLVYLFILCISRSDDFGTLTHTHFSSCGATSSKLVHTILKRSYHNYININPNLIIILLLFYYFN